MLALVLGAQMCGAVPLEREAAVGRIRRLGGERDRPVYSNAVVEIMQVDETFAAKTMCAENPCMHGGTCWLKEAAGQEQDQDGGGSAHWECACTPAYTGKFCKQERFKAAHDPFPIKGAVPDIDAEQTPCASNPCKHDGECVLSSAVAGYKCNCPGRYYGIKCRKKRKTKMGDKKKKKTLATKMKKTKKKQPVVHTPYPADANHEHHTMTAAERADPDKLDFAAAKLRLRAELNRLQHTTHAKGCACTRTLVPDIPNGGLGNRLHAWGLELVSAMASKRMLTLPQQITFNKGANTIAVEDRAIESPYATHPTVKSMCKADRTVECFLMPLARCRPNHAAVACPIAEKVIEEYEGANPYVYCDDCKSEHPRAKLHSPAIHLSVRTTGSLIGFLEVHGIAFQLDENDKPMKGNDADDAGEGTGEDAAEMAKDILQFEEHKRETAQDTVRTGGAERVLKDYAHYGDLWMFSQIMGYVWRLRPNVVRLVNANPLWKQLQGKKYMAFHVRVTDNSGTLKFHGLPAAIYSFKHFMELAEKVKREHNPTLDTIYIAADHFNATVLTPYDKGTWTFVYNKDVSAAWKDGTDKKKHEYYLNNPHTMDVLTDIEIMKKAQFIFGSHTSNYFKLAAELNYFYHDDRIKRFFEVDRIPWEKQMIG